MNMKTSSRFLIATFCAATLSMANAADISGKVTLKGTPPPPAEIADVKNNADCAKFHKAPTMTQHFIVGKGGELANVVVALKGVPAKSGGASAKPALLDQKDCLYTPQILAVQTGQKLLVKNSDPVSHNVHTLPAVSGNPEKNQGQAAGQPDLAFSFPKAENFLKFKCDIHPWMFAWVSVFDHPYFAVTDKDGKFTIKDVPPGKYTIEARHRKAAPDGMTKEIEVKDGGATADFILEVK
jgi:plastocyanin